MARINSLRFWDTNWSSHLIQKARPILNWKWKNFSSREFRYSSQPESENERNGKDRRVLRSCLRAEKIFRWYLFKGFGKEIREIGNYRKNPDLTLILTRILRRVLENIGMLLSLRFQWKTTIVWWFEKLTRCEIILTTIIGITWRFRRLIQILKV